MSYAHYSKDTRGIATITFDNPDSKVNVMNKKFIAAWSEALDQLDADVEDVKGVIVTSAKDTFFAGGDLDEIRSVTDETVDEYFADVMQVKALIRRMEKLGRPVVAAINGAALGGGYEICLACHHRVALDSPKVVIGLPEVSLGLLPGGGGVVRLVRLLGLKKALPLLLDGTRVAATDAADMGLVDELSADKDALIMKAREWIGDNPEAVQPWDLKEFRFPGGGIDSREIQQFAASSAEILKTKKRGLYPAPEAILNVAVQSMQVDIDSADRIESRGLADLATTQVAKNMITTFYQMNRLKGGESRPKGLAKSSVTKLGILGAGMMGSGIAYVAAKAGINVVLKDVDQASADKGKSYSDAVASKLIAKGRMSEEERVNILSRITATMDVGDLKGCDLIVEAVFEDRDLKAKVTNEAEAVLDDDALFASNTSTLQITGLAQASKRPEKFIGLHFFSPVDRMKLVEIIIGQKTSDETLARGYDFVRQLRKIPIVVNDSRDFYTSRVYESGCDEGAWMLSDGVDPERIDKLARQVGMPIGPLESIDAVSQQLVYSIKHQAQKDFECDGREFPAANEPPFQWITRMVDEFDRRGKAYGGGYYDYSIDSEGRRHKQIWSGLRDVQPEPPKEVSDRDIKDRVLYRQAIEAARCLEEGVLQSVADCNIGSMMGIGYPAWTGGQLQFINACGVAEFTARASELADNYGDRFTPPQLLHDMAESGETFE